MNVSRYLPTARHTRVLAASAAALVVLISGGLALALTTVAQAVATAVPLATAGNFDVLAGTTVTNTGPTTIIGGSVGVSPGSAVTGFPPGIVTPPGTIHAADATAAQAQSDLTVGYNVAAGEGPVAKITADLGGQELTPGVYNSASSISLGIGQSGTKLVLTLNGGNDPNAVFVFQAGSTLTTASASQVLLVNGAQSCNIFWQVGSSATLASGSSFVGSVLALTSIAVKTGSTIDGRVLARNGAVTLDDDTITNPTCKTVPTTTSTATTTSTSTTTPSSTTTSTTSTVPTGSTTTTTLVPATAPTTTTTTTLPNNAKPPISPPAFTG
jgi:hypothetical protein